MKFTQLLPACTICNSSTTSNVTSRHRGPKRKLRAGYRAPSLQRTSMHRSLMSRRLYLSSSSVVLHAFSVLCIYLKFGHHPHPLGYLCAKCHFMRGRHCWASPWRKIAYSITHSLTHSLTHLFDAPGTEAFTSELLHTCDDQLTVSVG